MQYLFFIISILLVTGCSSDIDRFKSDVPITEPMAFEDRVVTVQDNGILKTKTGINIPERMNLDVPFFPQAPDADWRLPWQEACEEASVVLAYHYATGQKLSKKKFSVDLLALVDWQKENLGDYKHTDIAQTARMLQEFYGFSDWSIVQDPPVYILKRELAQGHAIIAPFAGRLLGNPFFSGEGPLYHMLVIKGYDESHFIVNDVGTKRGENFIYPYETLMNALHEWHDENVLQGAGKILILK
jgi:hypothetical protein